MDKQRIRIFLVFQFERENSVDAKTDVVYCKAARSVDVYAAVSQFNRVSKQEFFRALDSPFFPAQSV